MQMRKDSASYLRPMPSHGHVLLLHRSVKEVAFILQGDHTIYGPGFLFKRQAQERLGKIHFEIGMFGLFHAPVLILDWSEDIRDVGFVFCVMVLASFVLSGLRIEMCSFIAFI